MLPQTAAALTTDHEHLDEVAKPSNDPNQTVVVVPAEERYRQISVAIPMASRPTGQFPSRP